MQRIQLNNTTATAEFQEHPHKTEDVPHEPKFVNEAILDILSQYEN